MLASGLACIAIGTGKFVFLRSSDSGNGVLFDKEVIVLKGTAGANAVISNAALYSPSSRSFQSRKDRSLVKSCLSPRWTYSMWLVSFNSEATQRVFIKSILQGGTGLEHRRLQPYSRFSHCNPKTQDAAATHGLSNMKRRTHCPQDGVEHRRSILADQHFSPSSLL
ncbi:hypothetical protein V8B97DRAFT_29701 [Scleroderma yunnanense]